MKAKRLLAEMPLTFPMAMLAAVLAFGMILASCNNETTSGSGSSGGGGGGDSGYIITLNTLAEKLEWLKNNAKSGGSYVLEVSADESIAPNQRLEYSGRDNITITLKGSGGNRIITLINNGNMFQVRAGVTLVLDNNITLRGRSFNTRPLIYVAAGGAFRMNNGAAITGNSVTDRSGGGVLVEGTFTMSGGTISGNAATDNGGGVNVSGGTFTMSGGTISGNAANNEGGGVNVLGKGIFSMSGGTISGNAAKNGGGAAVQYGNLTMNGGTISGNNSGKDGGGVIATNAFNAAGTLLGTGNFIMNGGTVSGNTALDGGGGVAASNEGIFILNNGSITGNTGTNGGGVSVAMNTAFTMSGGTITGNTAKTNGGGVYVWGVFAKTGGTITGYYSDRRNGNAVSANPGVIESASGHAVYAYYIGSRVTKRKEITAGPEVNLAYTGKTGSFSGEWDY